MLGVTDESDTVTTNERGACTGGFSSTERNSVDATEASDNATPNERAPAIAMLQAAGHGMADLNSHSRLSNIGALVADINHICRHSCLTAL